MFSYRKSLQSALAALLLLPAIFQSCSSDTVSDRRAELLSMVNDDAIVVVASDPSTILASAGFEVKGNKITASKELERLASKKNENLELLTELSAAKGIDYHNMVASVNTQYQYALFCLTDAAAFASWTEGKDFTKTVSGEYSVLSNGSLSIAVNGDIAMIANWQNDEPEAIAAQAAAIAETAKANPLKEWKAKRLCEAQTDLIYSLEGLAEAVKGAGMPDMPTKYYADNCKYATLSLTFEGSGMKANGESYDAVGHKTPMLEKGTYAPIPAETMAMIKDYQLAMAFSIPTSFGNMMANLYSAPFYGYVPKERIDFLSSVLDAFKSFGFGISVKDGAGITNFSFKNLAAVAITSYDKDKLEACISAAEKMDVDQEELAKAKAIFRDSIADGDIHSVSLGEEYQDIKFYYASRNDYAIMATDKEAIADNPARLDMPRDVLSYASLQLPKNHLALSLIGSPFGISAEGYAYDDSYEGEFKLTDCEGGLIYNILSLASKF